MSGLSVFVLGALVILVGIGYAMVGIPNENAAAKSERNVYYWADGTRMVAAGQGENRQNISFDKIPKAMQWAVISAENKSFYEDSGVDPMGIVRALGKMATGGSTQGGSTITQQYVKNTYLSQEQTISRKFKEMFISVKVGTKLSKQEILQGYLNTSYYGRGAYGIQAAAQTYYGKDAVDLTPSECAFLTALLKGATYYDPAGNEDIDPIATPAANRANSEKRWRWILGEMYKDHHLTSAEYQEAVKKYPNPQGRQAAAGMTGQISYLVDTAKKYVLAHSDIPQTKFDQGGYEIYTTFDKKKVEALTKAVKKIQKEKIDPKKREQDKFVQFGAASVKPNDGAVVALYGGDGYENGQFSNNAFSSGVPVGSTWKPFDLAAAMQYGTYQSKGEPISPMSKYNGDDDIVIKNPDGTDVMKDGKPFRQQNESDKPWGYIDLRKAMEQSVNTPFVQLGVDVGWGKIRDVAEKAGIPRKPYMADLNASFAIGTSTPGPVYMADAYATFAASGKQVDPYSVTKVKFQGEDVSGFDKPKVSQAMPENVANNMTDILENVIQNGTGYNAKELGRAAAGKTGTTDENKSAWFVGYTQQLSTAVAMFREDPKNPGLLSMNNVAGVPSIHGGDIPTLIWTDYMKAALGNSEDPGFPEATEIGEIFDGVGASPSPSPSAEPSEEPSETPTAEPTKKRPGKPEPSPSNSCLLGWCSGETSGPGGGDTGGPTGYPTGGTTTTSPPTTTSSPTGGNGNGHGGWGTIP